MTTIREDTRAAIAAYLDPSVAGIDGLGKVIPHPAKFTPEGVFYENSDPGHSSGAVIFLYLARQSDRRVALGGAHDGRKVVEFQLVLDCFVRSTSPKAEDCGQAADLFLDQLVTRIRADRNAGNPAVIFQWGEGTFPGGRDIEIEALYPKTIMGSMQATQVYASVRLTVLATEAT